MNSELLKNITQECIDLPWCQPPAGIPGNYPPRKVSVLGNGERIINVNGIPKKIKSQYPESVAYPLFQCAKNGSAIYKMRKFPKYLSQLIINLRKMVKSKYKHKAINIKKMFNVAVCNYYDEDCHQIAAHRDDERWLEFNEINNDGELSASIIASLTIYIDKEPTKLRNFEIHNDLSKKWETYNLENNSIILFSNHLHRAKSIGKNGESCRRINITFRTLTNGLLGLTGYGNFYRYMSLPYKINYVNDKQKRHSNYFIDSAKKANDFNKHNLFTTDIDLYNVSEENRKKTKKQYINQLDECLPRYVKPLCVIENYINYYNLLSKINP